MLFASTTKSFEYHLHQCNILLPISKEITSVQQCLFAYLFSAHSPKSFHFCIELWFIFVMKYWRENWLKKIMNIITPVQKKTTITYNCYENNVVMRNLTLINLKIYLSYFIVSVISMIHTSKWAQYIIQSIESEIG